MSVQRENSTEYGRHVISLETARAWPIIVGSGIVGEIGQYFDFSGYSCIVLIADTTVQKLYGEYVLKALETTGKRTLTVTLPVGERTKSLRVAERGYQLLLENNIDRRAIICALGGGVIGDLSGYIAATYLRGIDYLQLPTTLLAQVDSSIGGKVGVNFGGKKNMIGSFYQPRAIVCDIDFLKSLPTREMRNGMAEVIKYGLAMDAELLRILEQKNENDFSDAEMADIVMRCCSLKAGVVAADETERSGQRAILNFGHTIGHALEAAAGLRGMSHGKAVAVGMAAATRISERLGMLQEGSTDRIEKVISKFGLPTSCPVARPDDLLEAIRYDKKTAHGETGWVLLGDIGWGVTGQSVPAGVVRAVLAEVCR